MGADRTATFLADFSDGLVTCGIKLLVEGLSSPESRQGEVRIGRESRNPVRRRPSGPEQVEKVEVLSTGWLLAENPLFHLEQGLHQGDHRVLLRRCRKGNHKRYGSQGVGLDGLARGA